MKIGLKSLCLLLGLALLLVWQLEGLASERRWGASIALVLYAGVLAAALRRARPDGADTDACPDYRVAYATETGTARQLAQEICKRLRKAGFTAAPVALNQLSTVPVPERALLLVVSTTGNGDAPKTGIGWDDGEVSMRYAGCPFALLALGDRNYPRFCAFGLDVALHLQAAGAKPLFAPVQVSQADPRMLDVWFRQLLPKAD
ncbi:flavodoxin domain-containing protein [Marinobacterium sediminicola]|uniref:Flavodoxin n=1 Tax=Marinobacterium sediminicola TaxID=518898 RepID=A0ABY1RXX2_9GAMM|nr:flavodoxin family protein [Marinobacterium sediminicola]ULG68631.1 flavodoxin family protein [Marinobacterium sediminicola]SMR73154.1 Flavodoxin [Marinobacterium sediminicola]